MFGSAPSTLLGAVVVFGSARLRESEKKREDRYEKLPLFMIEKEYGGTEAGRWD